MKFLVFCILLPLVVGKQVPTTENWDDDEESITLKNDPTPTPKRSGPVKISLSGPFESSSTTEDPIIPLILRQLIENSINNEIEQENRHNNKSVENKTPLAYMTPPPPPSMSSTSSQEDDDDDGSTTTTIDPNSDEISTTTDSGEIDDFDITTISPKLVINTNVENKDESSEEDYKQSEPKTQPKTTQYAQKYQNYLPQFRFYPTEKVEEQMETTTTPNVQDNDDSRENQDVPQSPHGMDRITFPDQTRDETSPDSTTENQGQSQNAPTSQPEENDHRPVYYFFLRPRQYSDSQVSPGLQTMPSSSNNLMTYPTTPNSYYFLNRPYPAQQRMMMNYPQSSRLFPPFIAQDYQNQMPVFSNRQAYYNPMNVNNYPQQEQASNMYPQYLQQQSMYQNPNYMRRQNQMMYPTDDFRGASSIYSPFVVSPMMYRVPNYNQNYNPNYYYTAPSPSYYGSTNYDGNNNYQYQNTMTPRYYSYY
jgi:hypothetical protein